MQHIFINPQQVLTPDFFTRYYNAAGDTYQRIESTIDHHSFDKDSAAVRIELYQNGIMPVLVGVIYRGH